MAVLASYLLTEAPFKDRSQEPELPFGQPPAGFLTGPTDRLLHDLKLVFGEVQRRHVAAMRDFYPEYEGRPPWGYLWAVSIPCQECGRRFPLIGSYDLL